MCPVCFSGFLASRGTDSGSLNSYTLTLLLHFSSPLCFYNLTFPRLFTLLGCKMIDRGHKLGEFMIQKASYLRPRFVDEIGGFTRRFSTQTKKIKVSCHLPHFVRFHYLLLFLIFCKATLLLYAISILSTFLKSQVFWWRPLLSLSRRRVKKLICCMI